MSGEDKTTADNVVRVDFAAKRAADGTTRREIPIPKSSNSPPDPLASQKLEAFSKLIDLGMTMVTVDTRRPGVVVPPVHQGELQLNLNFSLRFGLDDFRYDDDDVRGSLSFGGVPHLCILPWSAVYMIRSHVTDDVAIFPSDLPPELHTAAAAELERSKLDAAPPPDAAHVDTPLRSLSSFDAAPSSPKAASPGEAQPPPDRPAHDDDGPKSSKPKSSKPKSSKPGLRLVPD